MKSCFTEARLSGENFGLLRKLARTLHLKLNLTDKLNELCSVFFSVLFLFFWREGKTGVLGKTSHGRVESQQIQPMYEVKDRIEPRPHWWKGECPLPALKLNTTIDWPGQLFRYHSESFLKLTLQATQ